MEDRWSRSQRRGPALIESLGPQDSGRMRGRGRPSSARLGSFDLVLGMLGRSRVSSRVKRNMVQATCIISNFV